jgi:hypothetical protein
VSLLYFLYCTRNDFRNVFAKNTDTILFAFSDPYLLQSSPPVPDGESPSTIREEDKKGIKNVIAYISDTILPLLKARLRYPPLHQPVWRDTNTQTNVPPFISNFRISITCQKTQLAVVRRLSSTIWNKRVEYPFRTLDLGT